MPAAHQHRSRSCAAINHLLFGSDTLKETHNEVMQNHFLIGGFSRISTAINGPAHCIFPV
jgi:hypothetical protein